MIGDGGGRLHDELAGIRSDVVRLAAMTTELIPRGTEVLLAMDLAGAQQIIEDDDIVDDLTLQIEDRCDHVLTLQQPVASDLRELITALRLTAEIERSADLMVNIAKGTRRIYGVELTPRLSGLIELMAEESGKLFRLAIDAYDERDAALASAIGDMDDRLDDLSSDLVHAVFDAHRSDGSGLRLQACVQLALIGRYYERIGDHAVNIAERVQFMVTGWRPGQNGMARIHVREEQARERAAEST